MREVRSRLFSFRLRLIFLATGYGMVGELHLHSLGQKLRGSVAWSNQRAEE